MPEGHWRMGVGITISPRRVPGSHDGPRAVMSILSVLYILLLDELSMSLLLSLLLLLFARSWSDDGTVGFSEPQNPLGSVILASPSDRRPGSGVPPVKILNFCFTLLLLFCSFDSFSFWEILFSLLCCFFDSCSFLEFVVSTITFSPVLFSRATLFFFGEGFSSEEDFSFEEDFFSILQLPLLLSCFSSAILSSPLSSST
mmetsp:Transcript_31697/g.49060  ORF Transcript_31697/g.49060 Transcript_31697/m.49060 type:complete len:200 (-) Transcript_31697:195-794(-)